MVLNKKGNFQDIMTWAEFAIGFFLVVGIVLAFVNGFDSQVQATNSSIIPDQVKASSLEYKTILPTYLDSVFPLMFIIFFGFSVMSARLINSTPRFILIAIFVLFLMPFLGMIIENVWDGWYQQPNILSAMSNMSITVFMLNNMRYLLLFYALGVSIALLSKEQG